jgi:hypothetical protein
MTPSAKAHGTMISGFPYPRVGSKLVELVSRCQIAVALFEPRDLFGFWSSRQLEPPLPTDHAYFVHQ